MDLCQRTVSLGPGPSVTVDLNRPVVRFPDNPILTAREVNAVWQDPALQVTTVHNAGVVRRSDETLLLFRAHLRSGLSVLGLARSPNGVRNWRLSPEPALKPATAADLFAEGVDREALIENEGGGVEDPRIMDMGDCYAITYSAYHATVKNRVRVSLATTEDFVTFVRHGPVLEHDMRNVVFFNEKIGDRFVGLFRPNDVTEGDVGGKFTQIRIGYAADWRRQNWQIAERPVMQIGGGPGAFSDKIGPGAPPIKTAHGWLNLFHGVRSTMDGNPYCLGVALHDLADPTRVKVSSIPILFPSAADCRVREEEYVHVPHVVFTCGAVAKADGAIFIYYGGNDTVMNVGVTHEDVLVTLCEEYRQGNKG